MQQLQFIKKYKKNKIYSKIIENLQPVSVKPNKKLFNVFRFEYIFRLTDGLLYFKDNESSEQFIVLCPLIQQFLQDVYDNKHYFGRDHMLQDLVGLFFRSKTYYVKKYMRDCYSYGMNCSDNRPFIKSLQSIQTFLQPIYIIFLDFIIAFFTMFSKDTLQVIEKFDTFDFVFTIICKVSKQKLFILDNEKYTTED